MISTYFWAFFGGSLRNTKKKLRPPQPQLPMGRFPQPQGWQPLQPQPVDGARRWTVLVGFYGCGLIVVNNGMIMAFE